jgi:hypothetical protein
LLLIILAAFNMSSSSSVDSKDFPNGHVPSGESKLNGQSRSPAAKGSKGSKASKGTKADANANREPKPAGSLHRIAELFPGAPDDGCVLRWGLAAGFGGPLDQTRVVLSQLGGGAKVSRKVLLKVDFALELEALSHRIDEALLAKEPPLLCLVDAVLWAYALPRLSLEIDEAASRSLSDSLQRLANHCTAVSDPSSLARLVGGCELSLVLAWHQKKQASKESIAAAAECLKQWCESPEASIGFAVRGEFATLPQGLEPQQARCGSHMRAVMASLLRSRALCQVVAKQKLKKTQLDTYADLATWVAAATRVGGVLAFSTATVRDVRDDSVQGGLLDHLKKLDPETLGPAIDAATGKSKSGGKLAWQISLPEAYCHSELGGTAILLPEWDVRRGRVHLDYGGEEVRVQVDAGKLAAIDGAWELLIQVDGQEQAAAAPWTSLCEYSDDDVHYLEVEQRWTGGIRVQRHLLLIREDRCVLLADAVIRDAEQPPANITYTSRIKLGPEVVGSLESETTEVWLQDAEGEKRGLALSLQSNEWRVGPTRARLDVTPDGNLRLEVRGDKQNQHGGSIFAPLWFDFQQRRFKRPRTWRQLTVAEDLRIVTPDESVAFRVQQGSEQWVIYRMLNGDRTRTFLGKHLLADLYCARFNPGDGNMEDLVTVGGTDDEDESQ